MNNNPIPSHASVRIGRHLFENLEVVSIDYDAQTVTILFEGFGESIPYTVRFTDVKSFTYNTHFPIA